MPNIVATPILTINDTAVNKDFGKGVWRVERNRSPFTSLDDLHQRVPELRKGELRKLAAVGALNFIGADVRQTSVCRDWVKEVQSRRSDKLKFVGQNRNRRDALWQVERVSREAGIAAR